MNKIKNITIVLITLFLLTITASSVSAATLSDVKCVDSKITVSGTCTTSDQVTIAIFDSDKQPIYFGTVKVEEGKFNSVLPATFDLKEGETFTAKTSDYDGTGVSTDTFVATKTQSEQKEQKDETPKTGDYLIFYVIALIVASVGIVASITIKKFNKKI